MNKRKARNNPESDQLELQPNELLRALMEITIGELKLGHDPWQKLSQDKQAQIIERVGDRSKDLLRKLLAVISAEGFERVQVTLEQVVIKDGIKAQVSLSKGEAGWQDLCAAQGTLCTLVLVNAEQFTGVPHGFHAELDQLPLPLPTANASVTDDARAAHIAAGGSDDALDLSELTSKRDLLVLAYAQQQAAIPVTPEQVAALDERIIDLRNANAASGSTEDTPEIAQLVAQRNDLADRLIAQDAAETAAAATPTADDLAALDAEIDAAREASGGFVETPEVTALLERRKAMAEAAQAQTETVAKAA